MLCVPVSTGTLKCDKSLKMPLDTTSECVICQNFMWGMPPHPNARHASYTMRVHIPIIPTLPMMTNMVVQLMSPFSKV